MESDEVTSGRPYKSRKSRPCDACRRRKVTCVMPVGPPCERCTHFNKSCTFEQGPSKRKRPAAPITQEIYIHDGRSVLMTCLPTPLFANAWSDHGFREIPTPRIQRSCFRTWRYKRGRCRTCFYQNWATSVLHQRILEQCLQSFPPSRVSSQASPEPVQGGRPALPKRRWNSSPTHSVSTLARPACRISIS